jgi:hypothetical protein
MRPADLLLPDRPVALKERRCIQPPIGCGKPIQKFDDQLSEKEYGISGLCEECQNEVFGSSDSEE